jgi:hypothetical protein
MSVARPPSTTFVVERAVLAPRSATWDAVLDVGNGRGPVLAGTTEVTLSHEPPWRQVTDISGTAFALYQLTVALQDHGDASYMVLGAFIELASADDPQDDDVAAARVATEAFAEAVVDQAQATVGSTRS